MDTLAITTEVFVLTIAAAIFGGMALLVVLDSKADRRSTVGQSVI